MARIILVLSLTLVFEALNAQIVANFTADTTEHCAPKRITFTDLSTGGGTLTYRKWEFGNGGISNSNDPNPSRLYTTGGLYTVTLTVSDGTDTASVTKVNYIKLFDNPGPDLSFTNLSQCVPKSVSFSDQTTLGDAPISSWEWDFGDLSPKSSQQNPTHSYNARGTYTVSLTVTDTNGCFASSTKTNLIVVESPNAHFTASGSRSDCQPPLNVSFNNSSTGGNGSLTYTWSFGDGNSSTARNPSNNYTNSGSYTVRLIATDTSGCKDTITRVNYVTIGQTTAGFNVADTLCKNSIDSLFNTSFGANSFSWDFGNGQTSTQRVPAVTYTSSGTYTIRLIASAGPTCIDTLEKTVYVQEVKANFGIDSTYFCQSPAVVNLTDSSSSNVTSWDYSFGSSFLFGNFDKDDGHDGILDGASNIQNPSFTLKLPFQNPGIPRVKQAKFDFQLIATTSAGCSDTLRLNQLVEIHEPDVYISVDSSEGCAPITVTFDDSTSSKEPVTNWVWDFRRSPFPNDTAHGPGPKTITFTQYGSYWVHLEITNQKGCRTADSILIKAGAKAFPQLSYTVDSLCQFDTATIFNNTIDTIGFNYGYAWSDGYGFGSNANQVVYKALNDTGWIDLTFSAWHLGCTSLVQIPNIHYVKGPIVSIGSLVNCDNPRQVKFILGDSIGIQRWKWSFGDGNVDSTNLNPIHSYSLPNTYSYSLTAYNDSTGCEVFLSDAIDITALEAIINVSDSIFCPVKTIAVIGDSSKGVFGNRYQWDMGNGFQAFFRSTVTGQESTYRVPGTYTIRLIVPDKNNCVDTAYQTIEVYELDPQISINPPAICEAGEVRFEDNTNYRFGLAKRYWIQNGVNLDSAKVFTDSLIFIDSLIGNTSQLQIQQGGFNSYVEDSLGCGRSTFHPVEVRKLQLGPLLTDSGLCEGEVFGGRDTIANAFFTHIWDYGDGTRDTNFQFSSKLFTAPGTYQVSLTVIDTAGCTASDTISVSMEHISDEGFTVDRRDSTCYPLEVYFSDSSTANNVVNRSWIFGDGSEPVNTIQKDSIRKIYGFPGVFDVKLVITTQNGCKDSVRYDRYINVGGPYAAYRVFPDSACVGDSINFILDSLSNVGTIDWDFGDGLFAAGGQVGDTIKHAYSFTGSFNSIMLYSDSIGTCTQFIDSNIVINQVNSRISIIPDSIGCVPLERRFEDDIKQATEWTWLFGDEGLGSDSATNFVFLRPDTHEILLAVFDETTGCRDTSRSQIIAKPRPVPEIRIPEFLCRGDSLQALGSGGVLYLWKSNAAFSHPDSAITWFFPDSSETLSLTVTDSNNCTDSTSADLRVVQRPGIQASEDTSIIIGEELMLIMVSDQPGEIIWKPEELFDCPNCPNPILKPLKDTTVCVSLTDFDGCFTVDTCIRIGVEGKFSLDLPETFTPNGDGNNDLLYIRGWGIQELLEWKIFNRWGELVFETTDLQEGWDGRHKGEAQNMETFSYTVRILNYAGEEMQKAGFVTLIR